MLCVSVIVLQKGRTWNGALANTRVIPAKGTTVKTISFCVCLYLSVMLLQVHVYTCELIIILV